MLIHAHPYHLGALTRCYTRGCNLPNKCNIVCIFGNISLLQCYNILVNLHLSRIGLDPSLSYNMLGSIIGSYDRILW